MKRNRDILSFFRHREVKAKNISSSSSPAEEAREVEETQEGRRGTQASGNQLTSSQTENIDAVINVMVAVNDQPQSQLRSAGVSNTLSGSEENIYDVDLLPHDSGKRTPITSYDVNDQDAVRRGYIMKGPYQPYTHDFPVREIFDCTATQLEEAGKAEACAGCSNQQICATAPKGPDPDLVAIVERMATVKHKILVLSGKGGVGKSTFSAQLSFALAEMDHQVGLLDIDICGPSIPKMLGLEGQDIHQSNVGWSPVYVEANLGVMSIGFMLPNPDDAVIWRGPRKNGLIKQFLKDVDWGEIDYLVVDAPPGTSDEHISIVQYLQATGIDGAIIVTTPQQVSLIDVRKEINFCKKVGVPVLGVVENMSGLRQALSDFRFVKPGDAGEIDATEWALNYIKEKAPELLSVVAFSEVFDSSKGGAEKMCHEMGVPFLGKVPMDPQLCKAAEEGRSCFVDQKCSASAPALKSIVKMLIKTE